MVLYFGTTRWDGKINLLSCFREVSEDLKPYLNDYHINLFELAFLDDETRSLFKSDFRFVVDFLHQVRVNKSYTPPEGEVQYVDELIKFLAAFSHSREFLVAANRHYEQGRPMAMTDLIGNMLADSEQKGAFKSTVDCVVNLVRSTKGNTNLNDALELLKVPTNIRDAVAEQAKAILAE